MGVRKTVLFSSRDWLQKPGATFTALLGAVKDLWFCTPWLHYCWHLPSEFPSRSSYKSARCYPFLKTDLHTPPPLGGLSQSTLLPSHDPMSNSFLMAQFSHSNLSAASVYHPNHSQGHSHFQTTPPAQRFLIDSGGWKPSRIRSGVPLWGYHLREPPASRVLAINKRHMRQRLIKVAEEKGLLTVPSNTYLQLLLGSEVQLRLGWQGSGTVLPKGKICLRWQGHQSLDLRILSGHW